MNFCLKYQLVLFLTAQLLLFATLKAQTGPGGVGNTTGTSTLKIWMRADLGATLASGKVSQWNDQSGSGNHFTMATAANQPSYATNVFNGYPTVRYIGSSSNYFDSGFSGPGSNGITIFLFAKGTSYQSLIRYQNNSGTFLVYPWEVGGGRTFISSSDGSTGSGLNTGIVNSVKNIGTGRYVLNTATTGFQTFLNGTLVGQRTSINSVLPTQPFYSGRYNPGASEYPTADVPEIIIYYTNINEAERIIVENYLAAKYDTLLTTNDIYTMDNSANGNYDHDVAGIGQASDGSNHTNSRGTGVVQVSNPGGLTNSEFFFWGKNSIAVGVTTNTNMPSSAPQNVQTRWGAEWRVSETGDVGTTNISFDITGFTPATASDLRLIIDTDNDGLFSDEVNGTGVISGATSLGANVYQFSGINISNGSRFTLGSINSVATPLPITLISFNAITENNSVRLNWTTAEEKNNKQFELYRAKDAVDWQLITTQKGNFNTEIQKNYEFIDTNPFLGLNYYKLDDVDINGQHKASPIISAEVISKQDEVKIYPNPSSSGEINIELNEPITASHIEVINAIGEKIPMNWIYKKDNIISNSPNVKISAGIYLIKYSLNEAAFKFKKIHIIGS